MDNASDNNVSDKEKKIITNKTPSLLKKICITSLLVILFILLNASLFYLLDFSTRQEAFAIDGFYDLWGATPILMTGAYLLAFLAISIILPRKVSQVFMGLFYAIFIALFVVNYMLLRIKTEAFSIYTLSNAGEGMMFLNFLLKEITPVFVITLLGAIILAIIAVILRKHIDLPDKKIIAPILLVVVGYGAYSLYTSGILSLETTDNSWEQVTTPRYYYDNFTNSKRNINVCGLYAYTFRDIRTTIERSLQKFGSEEEIKELISKYPSKNEKNEKTGMFKDKNVIMILAESIDNVAVSKENTPTLKMMMENGWNFPKRYSALSSGGSTIMTEYISVSGLYYSNDDVSKVNSNTYKYSLPTLFKNNGYNVSSVHANTVSYYNRSQLHVSLGFENLNFIRDIENGTPMDHDDMKLLNYYDLIAPKDQKFFTLIMTMAAHGPYDDSNPFFANSGADNNQLSYLKYGANTTDRFLAGLIDKLKEDGRLDDTVFVIFTDHQAYGYDFPEEYLATLPTIDNKHNIKALPFIIYNSKMNSEEFDDLLVNDTDIVPTVLNLFGIEHDPNLYVGKDLFSPDHINLSIFNDYTWYDGEYYSGNPEAIENATDYDKKSDYAKNRLDLSKMIISNNWYKK